MEDPNLFRQFRGHQGGILSLAFNPNLKHLASGSSDATVRVWHLRPPAMRAYLYRGHTAAVTSVCFSPNSNYLASASLDRTIRLWVPTVSEQSTCWRAHSGGVRSVHFAPDGAALLSAGDDKSVKLWALPEERFFAAFNLHQNWVRCAKFSPDGQTILSCSDDKTIKLWDRNSRQCVHSFGQFNCYSQHIDYHPSGTCFAAGCTDGSVKIWDLRNLRLVQHYQETAMPITQVSFHPNGNYLLCSSEDSNMKILDVLEGRPMYTLGAAHQGSVSAVVFSPVLSVEELADEEAVSSPRTPRSTNSARERHSHLQHQQSTLFASGGADSQVLLWRSNFDRTPLFPGGHSSSRPARELKIRLLEGETGLSLESDKSHGSEKKKAPMTMPLSDREHLTGFASLGGISGLSGLAGLKSTLGKELEKEKEKADKESEKDKENKKEPQKDLADALEDEQDEDGLLVSERSEITSKALRPALASESEQRYVTAPEGTRRSSETQGASHTQDHQDKHKDAPGHKLSERRTEATKHSGSSSARNRSEENANNNALSTKSNAHTALSLKSPRSPRDRNSGKRKEREGYRFPTSEIRSMRAYRAELPHSGTGSGPSSSRFAKANEANPSVGTHGTKLADKEFKAKETVKVTEKEKGIFPESCAHEAGSAHVSSTKTDLITRESEKFDKGSGPKRALFDSLTQGLPLGLSNELAMPTLEVRGTAIKSPEKPARGGRDQPTSSEKLSPLNLAKLIEEEPTRDFRDLSKGKDKERLPPSGINLRVPSVSLISNVTAATISPTRAQAQLLNGFPARPGLASAPSDTLALSPNRATGTKFADYLSKPSDFPSKPFSLGSSMDKDKEEPEEAGALSLHGLRAVIDLLGSDPSTDRIPPASATMSTVTASLPISSSLTTTVNTTGFATSASFAAPASATIDSLLRLPPESTIAAPSLLESKHTQLQPQTHSLPTHTDKISAASPLSLPLLPALSPRTESSGTIPPKITAVLEQMLAQLHMLTQTVTIIEQRVSLTEDKVRELLDVRKQDLRARLELPTSPGSHQLPPPLLPRSASSLLPSYLSSTSASVSGLNGHVLTGSHLRSGPSMLGGALADLDPLASVLE